jgi:RHS repeat-associated protein
VSQIAQTGANGSLNTLTQVPDNTGAIQSQTPTTGSGGVATSEYYDTLGDRTVNAQTASAGNRSNYTYDQLGEMIGTSQSNYTLNASTTSTAYQYTGDGLEAATSTSNLTFVATLLWSISCPTSTFCMGVDLWTGDYMTFNGTSWSTPAPMYSNGQSYNMMSVSCVSPTLCDATDGNGGVDNYNGSSWTRTLVFQSGNKTAISCTSGSFCMAVGGEQASVSTDGTTWQTATKVDSYTGLASVSCVSSTFCVAGDAAGNAMVYTGGSTWIRNHVDGSADITGISCPSASFCMAVDNAGNSLSDQNGTWSSPTSIDGSVALSALSCYSSTYCVAADGIGSVLTYNGTAWTAPHSVDALTGATAVSCWSANACDVSFGMGSVATITSTSPNVTTQLTWDTNGSLPTVLSDSVNDYVYGPNGEPVEQVNLATNTPTFLTYSPSNSSWLATNAAGNEASFVRYDAYGTLASGTPVSPFGYGGQYGDAATGFTNLRARWMDPQTGTFTSFDPAFAQTDQAYAYAGGDPVNGGDPSGQRPAPPAIGCQLDPSTYSQCVSAYQAQQAASPSIGFRFNPGAAVNAIVNIGRGASFGLSDTIANLISPGASCTVPQNGLDFAIGAVATTLASLGAASAIEGGGASLTERLLASGSELDPADAGGQLTRAGRAYAKAGEVFGPTSGGPAAINEAGQSALQEILTNPATTVQSVQAGNFVGGLRFVSPDGIQAVFGPDGALKYFGRT